MNRAGYLRIMKAVIDLLAVIMIEAGRVPAESAQRVTMNIWKAITGGAKQQ